MNESRGTAPGDDTPALDNAALVVMARDADGRQVKTRLAATVGDQAATTAYAALLTSTRRQVEIAANAWAGDGNPMPRLVLALDRPDTTDPNDNPDPRPPRGGGDAKPATAESRASSWRVLAQTGATLGERLAAVFEGLFAEGSRAVVIVGSDSPALPPEYLCDALAHTTDDAGASPSTADDAAPARLVPPARLVLGPAFDGGYYLIALSRESWLGAGAALTAVLAQTPTSTATTFADTTAAARVAGLAVDVLPYWIDVDHAADLPVAERLLADERSATTVGSSAEKRRTAAVAEPARGEPLTALREVYLHVTDRCAAGCAHCYNAGSASAPELSTAAWLDIVDQAVGLGATSFVLIGGDPFLRPDLPQLLEGIARHEAVRARLFFNRPLDDAAARALATIGHGRLTPLLSIDGAREGNDALRGAGNYDAALATAAALLAAGLSPVINTVLLAPVLPGLLPMLDDLARVGARRLHLIFPHQRGGLGNNGPGTHLGLVPSSAQMAAALDELFPAAAALGITVDNLTGWRSRRSARRDLCSAGCTMLAVEPTGKVHACPITAGDPGFVAGDLARNDLATIWRRSPSLRLLRHSHARDREACAVCDLVDACGGECWVQAHYAAQAQGTRMGYGAPFPYCDAVKPVLTAQISSAPSPKEAPSPLGAVFLAAPTTHPDLTPFECI
jgi:radical SAM protein with 4Fe4S-binding SPASM domain